MKSFKKSILAAGLALAVVTTIGGVAVFAAGLPQPVTEPSTLCGYGISGRSDMLYNTAYASTYYGGNSASVYVESTYRYWDNLRGIPGTMVKTTGHYKNARVEFNAPAGCKSVSISSTHNVYKNNQHWDATTFDDKEASLPY